MKMEMEIMKGKRRMGGELLYRISLSLLKHFEYLY